MGWTAVGAVTAYIREGSGDANYLTRFIAYEYAAAQAASIPIRAISLKAVCDKGDKEKNDKYQAYAARVSAAAVHRFIVRFSESLL